MKINLESSWDYYRKLNFFILNLFFLAINIGFTFFEKFNIKLFAILTFINLVLLFFLVLRKSISIENGIITAYHSFFGIKIKTINSLAFKKDSKISTKMYQTSSYYQKRNRYEPTLHVSEYIFEMFIDDTYLVTLYNPKSQKRLLDFVRENCD